MGEDKQYIIRLPCGIGEKFGISILGVTTSSSPRGAVTRFIARDDEQRVGIITNELDAEFGGAERYAFVREEIVFPEVMQMHGDVVYGKRMTPAEKRLIREHALAYELATYDGANTLDSQVQLSYISLARNLMRSVRIRR